MINALSFSRFLQLQALLFKAKQEEVREKFILAAFVGFQMGAAGDKNFSQYLESLGLLEEQAGVIPESTKITAKEAIAKAEEILAMARKKGNK